MKPYILSYNQINEANELTDLSFEEVSRLAELGLLDGDLLKIYYYIKNGSIGGLSLYNCILTHLPNWLTKVNGLFTSSHSNIEYIPDTLELTSGIFMSNSKLKEFTKEVVHGSLDLDNTQITKLPDGLIVNGYLSVFGLQFEEIPKNLKINGDFYIGNSNLEQFSDEELRKMYRITSEIIRES